MADLFDSLSQNLRQYWGYTELRPLQREAMSAVLNHRDSVVVLPTGGGKSLCFQAPAVTLEGTAIVISPLISLMKDQVDGLRNCGVPAGYLNSTQTMEERREVRRDFQEGRLKLLYLAPERIRSEDGYRLLVDGNVSFFAIDEAHCVSTWGHDFRPEYRELQTLRTYCPNAAIHAYTATATARVRDDIAEQLHLQDPEVHVGSFDRPNLSYVVEKRGKFRGVLQILDVLNRYRNESGVIYCLSRREVEELSAQLNAEGFSSRPYHAGLDAKVRKENQEAFINDRVKTIVATVAFGMGIDKSNVRYVIHAALPASLENYQQESGRAGRDGLPAECVLLYSGADVTLWQQRINDQPESVRSHSRHLLNQLLGYCESPLCRHRSLVRYFGQDLEADCGSMCDRCTTELQFVDDALVVAQKILSSVHRQGQRFGLTYTTQVLRGVADERVRQNGHDKLSTYGLLGEHSEDRVTSWIGQLVGQGFLVRDGEYGILKITEAGRRLLKGEAEVRLIGSGSRKKSRSERKENRQDESVIEHPQLFEELRKLRRSIADARSIAPYLICSDAVLKAMAQRRPSTLEAFAQVPGIGAHKTAEFGTMFVDAIVTWCVQNQMPTDAAAGVARTPPAAERSRPFGSYQAEKLFAQGKGIAEVAEEMKRAVSTVSTYLVDYLTAKKVTDCSPWVSDRDRADVEAAIEVVGPRPLKPLFEHLEGRIPYETLRFVVTCWENRFALEQPLPPKRAQAAEETAAPGGESAPV
jgi:ATP-dependent DNA helicase RecQ